MSEPKSERLLTLAELASYLQVGKKTVLKLASSKKIPGKLIGNEWRFRRGTIDEWLDRQASGDDRDFEEIPDGMHLPLGDLLPDEAIVHDMRARDALGAIEELAARAYQSLWLNDKPWFVGALVERETLSSTAMEGGVAFLHTRQREAAGIARPFIIVGRSYRGIDFGAPDGKPTYLFFLLGLKYDRLHLPILGRLARIMMHNPKVTAKLRSTTSPTKMRNTLLQLDAAELTSANKRSVDFGHVAPKLDREVRLRAIMRLSAKRRQQEKKEAAAAKAEKKASAKKKSAAAKKETAAKKGAAAKKAPAAKGAATKKSAATANKKASAAKKKASAAKKSAAANKSAAAKKKASAAKKKASAAKKSAASKKKAAATKKSAAAKKKPAAKKRTGAKRR